MVHGNTTHGGAYAPLYAVWCDMKQRCCNPNHPRYADYGGRGIHISIEWAQSYITFRDWAIANGYRKGLEIDRKDNDGNYIPSNCRLVTRSVNTINQRQRRGKSSIFRGVCRYRRNNCWLAQITLNQVKTNLGYFDSELQAAFAYDIAAHKVHGQYAKLNFPERYRNGV